MTLALEGDVGQGHRRLHEAPGGEGAMSTTIRASDRREAGRLCSGLFYGLAVAIVQPTRGALLPVCRRTLCVPFVLCAKARRCDPTIPVRVAQHILPETQLGKGSHRDTAVA